jgi:hypothetical protein
MSMSTLLLVVGGIWILFGLIILWRAFFGELMQIGFGRLQGRRHMNT